MNVFFYLAVLVASYFINRKAGAAPVEAATMDDFDFPQASESTPQQVVFGDVWISDWTVLSYGNFRTKAIKSSGGK